VGFREDREAIGQRADSLERELVEARQALQTETLRAAEVDDLRLRLDRLTSERDALRRGVEPVWRGRVGLAAIAFLVVTGVAGFVIWQAQRVASRDAHEIARLTAALDAAEPRVDAALVARDRAVAELEVASQQATEDARLVQHQLATAQRQETGEVYLVTGRVTASSGPSPTHEGALCALTARRAHGECIASVTCDGAPVFPVIEPIPPILCADVSGGRWTHGALGRVSSTLATAEPLFDFDGHRGTMIVREPAGPWRVTIDVHDALPLFLR
jgi:hypothetical protein